MEIIFAVLNAKTFQLKTIHNAVIFQKDLVIQKAFKEKEKWPCQWLRFSENNHSQFSYKELDWFQHETLVICSQNNVFFNYLEANVSMSPLTITDD